MPGPLGCSLCDELSIRFTRSRQPTILADVGRTFGDEFQLNFIAGAVAARVASGSQQSVRVWSLASGYFRPILLKNSISIGRRIRLNC
jgi:hypothetical protein